MNVKINGITCTSLTEVGNVVNTLHTEFNPGNATEMMHKYRQIISKLGRAVGELQDNNRALQQNNDALQGRVSFLEAGSGIDERTYIHTVNQFRNKIDKLETELAEVNTDRHSMSEKIADQNNTIKALEEQLKFMRHLAQAKPKPIPEEQFGEGVRINYNDGREIIVRKHNERPHYLVKIKKDHSETKFVLSQEALAGLHAAIDHVEAFLLGF